jgi:hypothetical protein
LPGLFRSNRGTFAEVIGTSETTFQEFSEDAFVMQCDKPMLANGFAFKCGHFPQEVLATPEPGRSGVPFFSDSHS